MITAFNPEIKYHDRVYSPSHPFLSYEISLRERSAQESRRREAPTVKVLGDGCSAKSEKRIGAACARVCVCLPVGGCLCLRRGSREGTQRDHPAAHTLRGRSGLAQPGARLGGGGARLRGPGRPLGVSVSPPLAALPDGAGAH